MASSRRLPTSYAVATYGTGKNYTALATWEADTDINLVLAQDGKVLDCYDTDASFDDSVVIAGATTNSSYFRVIRPASGEGHNGTPTVGVTFICTSDVDIFANNTEDYFQIQDIITKLNINSSNDRNCFLFYAGAAYAACVGCMAVDSVNAGSGTARGFTFFWNAIGATAINCLAHNNEGAGFTSWQSSYDYCYNCTSDSNAYGFHRSDTDAAYHFVLKNCIATNNTTADYQDIQAGDITTCVDSNDTVVYVDSANDDFHLASGATDAVDQGTDLSADAVYAFSDDIDKDARG